MDEEAVPSHPNGITKRVLLVAGGVVLSVVFPGLIWFANVDRTRIVQDVAAAQATGAAANVRINSHDIELALLKSALEGMHRDMQEIKNNQKAMQESQILLLQELRKKP
jgi:hypothetical protein